VNKVQLQCNIKDPHRLKLKEGRPYIFMCNHASAYDIPVSLHTLPGSIRMLVKKELVQIPIWGRAMIASGFVSVDRQNKLQAFEDLKKAKKAMEKGIVLLIFPETTNPRKTDTGG